MRTTRNTGSTGIARIAGVRAHVAPFVLALALLPASLSGCGLVGGDGRDGGDNGGGAKDKEPTAAERDDAMLEYARCMRENGVPMEDPRPGGKGLLVNGKDVDEATVRAAEEKCHELIESVLPQDGPGGMDPEQKEAMLAQAACMREHGWDVPDPQFDGGRVTSKLGGGIDPSDPKFQEDQRECFEESGMEMPRMEGGS